MDTKGFVKSRIYASHAVSDHMDGVISGWSSVITLLVWSVADRTKSITITAVTE